MIVGLAILYRFSKIIWEQIDRKYYLPKREEEARKERERFGLKW